MSDDPNECTGRRAYIKPRPCAGYIGNNEMWEMVLCDADTINGVDEWFIGGGINPAGTTDLISTIAHEFGHILNLHHPDRGFCGDSASQCQTNPDQVATMCPTQCSDGLMRQRQLYKYDQHCIQELENDPHLNVQTRSGNIDTQVFVYDIGSNCQEAPGYFCVEPMSNEDEYKGSTLKLAPSNTYRGMLEPSTTHLTDVRAYESHWLPADDAGFVAATGVTPTLTQWQEAGFDEIRMYHHRHYDDADWERTTEVHQHRFDFTGSGVSMFYDGEFYAASQSNPVESAYRMSHTFHDDIGQELSAYNRQTRVANTDYTIQIASAIDVSRLDMMAAVDAVPHTMTDFSPSIACGGNPVRLSDGDFDCIVAYADMATDWPFLTLQYFNPTQDPNTGVNFSSEINVVSFFGPTGGGPAIWYDGEADRWFVATLNIDASEILVFRSDNGTNFNYYGSLGYSITSPVSGNVFYDHALGVTLTQPK